MKWFDEYGWVVVLMSFVMIGAQIVRALLHWLWV